MSDFTPNKLSFNIAACMNTIKWMINFQLDHLSAELVRIVQREIQANGNGSSRMKSRAIWSVRETKREVTNDHVLLEVGIDTDELKSDEELFVCVSVVLHGNMKGAGWTWRDAPGVLYTKPGVETYGKHVTDKRVHVPEWYKPRALPPGFSQPDVMKNISDNVEKEIRYHVEDFMETISRDVADFDWSEFIIVG